MKNINQIDCQIIKNSVSGIEGVVKIDNHGLNIICPVNQGTCYSIILEESDQHSIYLIHVPDFENQTIGDSFKVVDVKDSARQIERVENLLAKRIDLTISAFYAPIFVSASLGGPLIAIDGNHRMMAHFLTHGSIEGVHAYLYVHPNIVRWGWNPLRTV